MRLTLALVVILVASVPRTARAAQEDEVLEAVRRTMFVVGGLAGVVSLFANGANGATVYRQQRAGNGWVATGGVIGISSVAAGVVVVESVPEAGIPLLGYGALTLGLAVWAGQQPLVKRRSAAFAPVIFRDHRGDAVLGLGMSALRW